MAAGSGRCYYQLPGSNAIAAAKGAKALMAEAKKRFPPGLDYAVALDTTLPVTEGIVEINHTIIEAVILVISWCLSFFKDGGLL